MLVFNTYSQKNFRNQPGDTAIFSRKFPSPSLNFGGGDSLVSRKPFSNQIDPKRKSFSLLKLENMNPFQKVSYGVGAVFISLGATLMTLVMPKKNLGHTLAFNRKVNISSALEKELESHLEGKEIVKKTRKQEYSEAWDTFKRTNMSILFAYFASKNLAIATVHLDPDYITQVEPNVEPKLFSTQFEERHASKDIGFLGRIAVTLMSWNLKFSEKYDLKDENDYFIPDPPPKLNFMDKFFLKQYFKTKPSWDYTESERLKIAESYRAGNASR